jgi:hypothetical protein
MSTPRSHNNDRDRCTHETRVPGTSQTIRCGDAGRWTFDRKAKTWRPSTGEADRSRKCWAHGPGTVTTPIGPRARKPKPNIRTQRAVVHLLAIGTEITRALMDVNDELSLLGFPSHSTGGAGGASDPVGNDAARIYELTSWREDMRDAIQAVTDAVDHATRTVARQRRAAPVLIEHEGHMTGVAGIKLCADNQQGRAGSIEWGDATCTELPTQHGLCASCYQAERRWRKTNDLPGLEQPAA